MREFDELVGRMAATLVVQRASCRVTAVHLASTNSPAFVAVVARDALASVRGSCRATRWDAHPSWPGTSSARGRPSASVRRGREPTSTGRRPASIAVDRVRRGRHRPRPTRRRSAHRTGRDWDLRDRAAVMFTSGTTGRPEGCRDHPGQLRLRRQGDGRGRGPAADHRQLVVLPLFHANAQYYSFASAIWAGASVALMHTFSASGSSIRRLGTGDARQPVRRADAHDPRPRRRRPSTASRLQHCWYAMNISDDQYERAHRAVRLRPRQLYGMTETIPAVLTDEAIDPVAVERWAS